MRGESFSSKSSSSKSIKEKYIIIVVLVINIRRNSTQDQMAQICTINQPFSPKNGKEHGAILPHFYYSRTNKHAQIALCLHAEVRGMADLQININHPLNFLSVNDDRYGL